MSCECLDPICLKVGVNPCESTKLPINLEYGDYILEFGFGGSSMNIEIEVNEEFPNVVIASGRLNEDMTYILRVWDKDANEYLSECYQLTTFLVRGVSNNGGSDPNPTPTPSDLDNLEFTELTATPDYGNNEITISATIIDNEGVPQTQSTTFEVPLQHVAIDSGEYVPNGNGQRFPYVNNYGEHREFFSAEPYDRVATETDIKNYPVDADVVGRIVLLQGGGWFMLFDSDPSSNYDYVFQSSYDSNYWWAEVTFGNWASYMDNFVGTEIALRWKIASGTHSNNTVPKVTATGELGSSNISDSGTIVTIGGNGLTVPNTTATGATTNGLIKYNTTSNEYRGVRSGVELKFLQTGDVTMSRFVWVNSATGTDTRTGLSVYSGDRPFATLQAAVTACASGDTIVVMNSTLTENVTIGQSKGTTLKVILISTTFTGNIENIRSIECMQNTIFNGRPIFQGGFVNPTFQGDKTCTWNITSSSFIWIGSSRCYIRGFGTISNLSSATARFIASSGVSLIPADFNKDVTIVVEDIALLSVQNLGTLGSGVLFRNIDKITVSGTRAIDIGSSSRAYFKNCYNIECAGRFILSQADAYNYYTYFDDCNVRGGAGNLFDTSASGATGGLILKAKSTNFYATGDYVVSSNAGISGMFIQLNFCTIGCASATHAINFTSSGYPSLSITSCYGNPPASHNLAPTDVYVDYDEVTNLQTNQMWN